MSTNTYKAPDIVVEKDYWTKEKMISFYTWLNNKAKIQFANIYNRWYKADIEEDYKKSIKTIEGDLIK